MMHQLGSFRPMVVFFRSSMRPRLWKTRGESRELEFHADHANPSTVIGVQCKDGVIMGVEKLLISNMLVTGACRRLLAVDKHLGMGICGLLPDGRSLVKRARAEARNYKENFGLPMPPKVLAERIGDFMHYFTLHGGGRPFGASVMISGYDADASSHELYMVEPSGISFKYYGCAAGKGRQAAKTEIEKDRMMDMTCKEALKMITKVLHVLHDDVKDKPFELELSWCCEETAWKFGLVPPELRDECSEWAKKKIEEEEEEEEDDDDDDDDDED